ncbi:MAG: GDSL-type esterase/lipase family protein [Planctomycetaceae bacterium]
MPRPSLSIILCSLLLSGVCSRLWGQDDIARWEPEIRKLEALDQQQVDPQDAILFLGSSSIRLWESVAQDVAPYPTIRRGYGGAKFSDLNAYVDRLVVAHKCRAMVIFVANDITGGANDKSPEEVVKLVASITTTIRKTHPETPIFYVEVTPTFKRWPAWKTIRTLNSRIAEYCSDTENVHFISTAANYLDPKTDEPIATYFREDQLHQNADGYKVWGRIIKARLDQVLGSHVNANIETTTSEAK